MEVEIWSDVACPWCYVGKRRFERALAQFDHADDVDVIWRSFELDPQAPAEIPGASTEMLARKYGMPVQRAQEMNDQLTALAAEEGLEYRLGDQRLGSTFDAHRLIHFAAESGLQDAMKERLLRARLSDGELVSDPEVLVACAVEVGLDGEAARAMLGSEEYREAVRADEQTAHGLGIQGVPMFVVDRRLGASGAQPPEQLLSLLRQGWQTASEQAAQP